MYLSIYNKSKFTTKSLKVNPFKNNKVMHHPKRLPFTGFKGTPKNSTNWGGLHDKENYQRHKKSLNTRVSSKKYRASKLHHDKSKLTGLQSEGANSERCSGALL